MHNISTTEGRTKGFHYLRFFSNSVKLESGKELEMRLRKVTRAPYFLLEWASFLQGETRIR